jgi:hypothetical protein
LQATVSLRLAAKTYTSRGPLRTTMTPFCYWYLFLLVIPIQNLVPIQTISILFFQRTNASRATLCIYDQYTIDTHIQWILPISSLPRNNLRNVRHVAFRRFLTNSVRLQILRINRSKSRTIEKHSPSYHLPL